MKRGPTRVQERVMVGGLVCVLAIAGCVVGPNYQRPTVAPPSQWKAQSPWKEAQPADTDIRASWWELFDDPVLSRLEEQAATNSPEVGAASARVEQARAVARISRADLAPNLNLTPFADRERFTRNRPAQTPATTTSYIANDFVLPLDLSYEVDVWGRVKRSFRAARASAQATVAAYRTVLLSLQADIAQTYFTIRSLDLQRRVVGEAVQLRQRKLELVQSMHQGGAASALDVAQAQTEVATAEASLIGLGLRRIQLENALALLCGQSASQFTLAESTRTYRPPNIPTALPSQLLERRPDVAEAERNMAAANEGVGIAKAAFFPAIRLTGFAGVESAELRSVFDWESRQWGFGPRIDLSIFEGGRNRAGLERSRAAYQEATERYRQQALIAFREVEDALIGLRLLKDQFDAQLRAVAAAKQAADLSLNRYREGLVNYLEVVDAERTSLENQILAYALNGQRMVNSVLLIKALGGGWDAHATTETSPTKPAPSAK